MSDGGPTAEQRRVVMKVVELSNAHNWLALYAMVGDALQVAGELREVEPQWAGAIYYNAAGCYTSLGEHANAIEQYEQSLAIFEELGDRVVQGNAVGNLANCYQSLGLYAKAIEQLKQSCVIFEELDNRAGQGNAFNGLGNCFTSLGQYAKAIELFEQSLVMKKEVGDSAGQGKTFHGLGNCYTLLGQYAKAIELFEQSLAIDKELGDRAGQGKTFNGLGNCYNSLRQHAKAIELFEQSLAIKEELGDRAGQAKTFNGLGNCYLSLGQYAKAIDLYKQALSICKELSYRTDQGQTFTGLGNCYTSLGQYTNAIELYKQALAIAEEVGDREGQAAAYNNIGAALALSGDATAATRALARGLIVWQRVEQDVGAHDDRRVSVFEAQQKTYRQLQTVLLGQGGAAAGWALGVAAEAKGRALAYRLAGRGGDGDDAGDRMYEDASHMCEAWWAEVQQQARAEGAATRVLEYSFILSFEAGAVEERLAIWVVSGATGELLCSKVVASTGLGGSAGRSIQEVLAEARSSMNVRGRDAMSDSAPDAVASSSSSSGLAESSEPLEELLSTDGDASAPRAPRRDLSQVEVAKREGKLLQELYAALIAPVEGALKGAEEVLIIPHQELYEVPWAALTDADGRYLIERHVIRTTPSLRVARQAADKMQASMPTSGHVVLVGNPLPIPKRFRSLKFADKEIDSIYKILNRAGLEVLPKHHFRENLNPPATKANVKNSLEGAAWAHMALHGDLETDSLVLAIPRGSADQDKDSGLSMREVQGSEQEQVQGVQMAAGATVVLSACNTGRGEIKAEGVVGIARGFLLANASATVVSLWSVADKSTAALMRIKYKHLAQGVSVPQALRLAMLTLARRRPDPLAVPNMETHPPEACEGPSDCQQGRQDARDRGRGLDVDDFDESNDGDGLRDAGSGGVVPGLRSWMEMLSGGTEGERGRGAGPAPTAHAGMHMCETEEERWQYWHEFCKRQVAPKCVLDFPFADRGGLELSEDAPDERLLERLYCFEDREDDLHRLLGTERRRVIIKVHTLRKWRERGDQLYQRASKVTAVKVKYAYWNPSTRRFEMECRDREELKLLPVSKQLQHTWRDAYRKGHYSEVEWEWRKEGSMPSGDPDTGDGKVQKVYQEVRAAIKLGESVFARGTTTTGKSMQGLAFHSRWHESLNIKEVSAIPS
jgi:tetratricopeptide (TPR) repeat protein/CHAT domain-containing protein